MKAWCRTCRRWTTFTDDACHYCGGEPYDGPYTAGDRDCPLCGTPFAADTHACDHEAGWYRQWLAAAATEISRLRAAEEGT